MDSLSFIFKEISSHNATMQDERNFYHYKKSEFEKNRTFSNFYEYMIGLMETLVKIQKKLLNSIKSLTHN